MAGVQATSPYFIFPREGSRVRESTIEIFVFSVLLINNISAEIFSGSGAIPLGECMAYNPGSSERRLTDSEDYGYVNVKDPGESGRGRQEGERGRGGGGRGRGGGGGGGGRGGETSSVPVGATATNLQLVRETAANILPDLDEEREHSPTAAPTDDETPVYEIVH